MQLELRRKNSTVFEEVPTCNTSVLTYNDKQCLDVVRLLTDDVCCLAGYIPTAAHAHTGTLAPDAVRCLELGTNQNLHRNTDIPLCNIVNTVLSSVA